MKYEKSWFFTSSILLVCAVFGWYIISGLEDAFNISWFWRHPFLNLLSIGCILSLIIFVWRVRVEKHPLYILALCIIVFAPYGAAFLLR